MVTIIATAILTGLHLLLAYGICKLLGFDAYYGMFYYFLGTTINELYSRVKYEQERREKDGSAN